MECAPIVTEGFKSDVLNFSQSAEDAAWYSDSYPMGGFINYNYGNSSGYRTGSNATFVYDNNTFGWTAGGNSESEYEYLIR